MTGADRPSQRTGPCADELSFTPVKINAQKINPAKSDVDFQLLISAHQRTGLNVVIINSVELNILLG
jgi:hypothetical protein